jgi:hypothetical protein
MREHNWWSLSSTTMKDRLSEIPKRGLFVRLTRPPTNDCLGRAAPDTHVLLAAENPVAFFDWTLVAFGETADYRASGGICVVRQNG